MSGEVKYLRYAGWEEKEGSYLTPENLYYRFHNVDEDICSCNDKLSGSSIGEINYTSLDDRFREYEDYCARINSYLFQLGSQIGDELDGKFYRDANEAAQYLSEIKLADFLTDNIVGVTVDYTNYGGDFQGEYTAPKYKIGFEDFLGSNVGETEGTTGVFTSSTTDCVEDFAQLFEQDYNRIKDQGGLEDSNINSLEDYLDQIETMGEFDHDLDRPFLNFISGALDITIIKPLVECATGRDLITKERLTDNEKVLKFTSAAMDIVTLGYGLAATGVASMGKSQAIKFAGKYILISASGDLAGYTAGYVGNEMGLPTSVCLIMSIASNAGMSATLSKLLYKGSITSQAIFDYADEQLDIPKETWDLGPVERGTIIDNTPEIKNNLGHNFPTVDSLYDGVLSSTKSYDITGKTYMDAKKWLSRLKSDIKKLGDFTERRWSGILIDDSMYDSKCLNVVLPNVELTDAQKASLALAKEYAEQQGVHIKVYITK